MSTRGDQTGQTGSPDCDIACLTPTNSESSVPQVRMLPRQVEAIRARQITLKEWKSRSAKPAPLSHDRPIISSVTVRI